MDRTLPRSGIISRNLAVVFWCVAIAWGVSASLIDMRLFSFANTLLFIFGGMCAGLADALRERDESEDEDAESPASPRARSWDRPRGVSVRRSF